VIATGIGRSEKAKFDMEKKKVASIAAAAPFRGESDLQDDFDVPTFRRAQRKEVDPLRIIKAGGTSSKREEADLDVPTFLRQPVAD
jgi:hypothetical protein